jgi:hypothetical protein
VDDLARTPAVIARRALLLLLGSVLLTANLVGLPYYLAGAAERMRHSLRPWFKPSGLAGQSLGLVALVLFLFLWLYPLRKRLRRARLGPVSTWLEFHIVAGIFVPLAAATHASWRFTGLSGLGYASMAIVALSGVVGRYLYIRIPRRRDGVELDRDETAAERRSLVGELSAATGLAPDEIEAVLAPARADGGGGPRSVAGRMLRDDVERRRAARELVQRLSTRTGNPDPATLRRVSRLARREMALAQQVRLLDAVQRLFRFWHVAHRPLAVMALIAVLVHVAVAVAVGQTWFR